MNSKWRCVWQAIRIKKALRVRKEVMTVKEVAAIE
jgi:hypothetical protein